MRVSCVLGFGIGDNSLLLTTHVSCYNLTSGDERIEIVFGSVWENLWWKGNGHADRDAISVTVIFGCCSRHNLVK